MDVFAFILGIIFLIVVLPIWLVLNYSYKAKKIRGLDDDDKKELDSLLSSLDELLDRVDTLEQIVYEQNKRES